MTASVATPAGARTRRRGVGLGMRLGEAVAAGDAATVVALGAAVEQAARSTVTHRMTIATAGAVADGFHIEIRVRAPSVAGFRGGGPAGRANRSARAPCTRNPSF